MAEVSLKQVRKAFGKTEVVRGVDVDIQDGEMIVIVGPSGCGKSTLLRMVAGLETVTSGEISIAGKRVNDLEPMDRDIAMVFQNYALYPHMSVFDNMAYGLKIAGRPKAEIAERVRTTAKLLQIEGYLERKPRQLSGGQRQRVAMGRAIVRKPSVFLFDEPLSNLDAKLRVQMRLDIKALQRQLGVTALYVTHDQVEAMTLADRMIVMNDGRAEQIGVPLDVYGDPETQFVAGFIGSPPMNFLPAETLPQEVRARLDGVAATVIGIRPEHLQIGGRGGIKLTARTDHAEALGAETLIHLRLESGDQLTVRQEGTGKVLPQGMETIVLLDPEKLCFFDADGRRIRA